MSGDVQEQPRSPSLFWLVHGQIAAMLGAFSLLVFLTHFFDFGLKGVVRDAFDIWKDYVRPAVGSPIQWVVSQFPEAWRFHLSDLWKDYFAVGTVSLFSLIRTVSIRTGFSAKMLLLFALWAVPLFIAWPAVVGVWLVVAVWAVLEDKTETANVSSFFAVFFAPLIYLALLFAANTWLPA